MDPMQEKRNELTFFALVKMKASRSSKLTIGRLPPQPNDDDKTNPRSVTDGISPNNEPMNNAY